MKYSIILSEEVRMFLKRLPVMAMKKILYNIDKVANGHGNNELFKKLEHTQLWEFRTLYEGVAYRLLAFWDTEKEALVIVTHGFVKKSQRTPTKEIAKAEEKRRAYFDLKKER